MSKIEMIKKLQENSNWVKMWSAKGSLLFASHLGEVWVKQKNINKKPTYKQIVFLYKNGVTDCWVSKEDRDDLFKRLNLLASRDSQYIKKVCNNLKVEAKEVLDFVAVDKDKEVDVVKLKKFWNLVYKYYLSHIVVKYLADSLSKKDLKNALSALEKARLFAEPVYKSIENYISYFLRRMIKKEAYTKEMLLAITKKEFSSYLKNNKLPEPLNLNNRYQMSAVWFDNKNSKIFSNKEAVEIENIILSEEKNIIKGQTGYKGKVSGRVRIVLDPSDQSVFFRKGDILVAGMTRAEYLPFLIKASAFITDSGGVLSHVAISAREMKKPCVIGTKNATKILKDGDIVEIDAEKGVVKLVSRK